MALFYMSISIGGLFGPVVLGYVRSAKFFTVSAAWHVAFSVAAFGMAVAAKQTGSQRKSVALEEETPGHI